MGDVLRSVMGAGTAMPEVGERVQGTVRRIKGKLAYLETFLGSDELPVELRLNVRDLDKTQRSQLAVDTCRRA